MNRDEMITRLRDGTWDVLVIGGGATGLGCALDAASRGYRTALVERADFASGTSSRSTKLIHGGVRYLRSGNVGLVLESLRERGTLRRNAPHLVHDLQFVVPVYDWWEGPFYGIGLRVYDLLAGRYGFGRSRNLSRDETIERLPTIETDGLRGGVVYYDGQFDDARLAIALAQTAVDHGATVANYARVTKLLKNGAAVSGVTVEDAETGASFDVTARAVINATGVMVDDIRRLDEPGTENIMRPSRGSHIVLDASFLPGTSAIMVPETDDGRVLFAIPWRGHVVVGTTDVDASAENEPAPTDDDIAFLLDHVARYLAKDPTLDDIRSAFAGLRPLVSTPGAGSTASISRDHEVVVAPSGLVTVAGGKWTTYRVMARDAIDQAAVVAGLDDAPCATERLDIHGAATVDRDDPLSQYGSDAPSVRALIDSGQDMAERLGESSLAPTAGEVVWAARNEMARTVDDVLARRSRLLVLDARAAMAAAPRVADILARELGRDRGWIDAQTASFNELAARHLPR